MDFLWTKGALVTDYLGCFTDPNPIEPAALVLTSPLTECLFVIMMYEELSKPDLRREGTAYALLTLEDLWILRSCILDDTTIFG